MSAAAKAKCWEQVAEKVTAASGIQRSAVDVTRKFVHMKSEAKSASVTTK